MRRQLGHLGRDAHRVFRMRVEARAHRRAAEGQFSQVRHRAFQVFQTVIELSHPTADLLASVSRRAFTLGNTRVRTASTQASDMAAGNTSFDDWPRFTWSFG